MPWLSKRSYLSLTHYPHNKQLLIKLRSHLVFSTTVGRWFLARATLWYDISYVCPFFHHPAFLFFFFPPPVFCVCVVFFKSTHYQIYFYTLWGFFLWVTIVYIYIFYKYINVRISRLLKLIS